MNNTIARSREAKSKFAQAFALAFCALAAGCTLVPGLNISERDTGNAHQFRVESDSENTGYKIVKDNSGVNLEVIDITPEVISKERLLERQNDGLSGLDTTNPGVVPDEYRVGPGDSIAITVWDHPELTNPIGITQDPSSLGRLVAADGTIFYPFIGAVKVEGKTVAELRQLISRGIQTVIAAPQVDVRVVGFRARRIQVFGEVTNPGVVNLDDTPKGVIEAISERNGLTANASRRRVFLSRAGKIYVIDFAGLLSGSRIGFDPVLKAGDILQVPDKSGDQVFMLGQVTKAQPVFMQQDRMTLTEALTTAGGLDQTSSDDGGVLVFRRPNAAGQPPRVFKLDMSNPVGMLLAGEFEMQPRDVVYVKRTAFAKFNALIAELAPSITAIYQLTYIDYLQTHP